MKVECPQCSACAIEVGIIKTIPWNAIDPKACSFPSHCMRLFYTPKRT